MKVSDCGGLMTSMRAPQVNRGNDHRIVGTIKRSSYDNRIKMRANSRAIVILTFFAGFVARVWAADPPEYEVRKAQDAFAHCWATRDAGCMDKVLAPDFTWVFRTGIEVDRATFLAAIMDGTTIGPNFFSTDDAVVHFYGPVALLTFAGTTNPPTILTLVWFNSNGEGWRLVRGQGTFRANRG